MVRICLCIMVCIIGITTTSGQGKPEAASAKSSAGTYTARINCNMLSVDFDADGNIGYTGTTGTGGTINNTMFLFSSGCMLTGYYQNTLWASGGFRSSLILDFIQNSGIFSLNRQSPEFGSEWNDWKTAVHYGAKFYDGDNDGQYTPVDRNANGRWDPTEDRPDILGDQSYFCSYSDALPSANRRFANTSPMGLTIGQTVFAAKDNYSLLRSTIFIRYTLINTGSIAAQLDSVYFTAAIDPDLGNSADDLAGCDTVRQSGFCYQKATDSQFDVNTPGVYIHLLQGPVSYIPGITFTDINNNGVFNPGIDVPLDSAYLFNGPLLGKQIIPGAKNLAMTSITNYIQSHPVMGDPSTVEELRNYVLGGKDKNGLPISPCNFSFGTVVGAASCSTISPRYMFSGDPVVSNGWLNNYPTDQRILVNSGPFTLYANQPMDIVLAYVVGRAPSSWPSSLILTREMDDYIQQVYNNNFSTLTPVDGQGIRNAEYTFALEQNYPNPFNPATTISYTLPQAAKVTLTVFDALGREVAVLVNGTQNTGRHEVQFNAANLSSGIYFYTLTSAAQTISRKLVVLK